MKKRCEDGQCSGIRQRLAGAGLAFLLTGLVPNWAAAVETDRITVEDPATYAIKFKVTSEGNVTASSYAGDGSALINVPHFKGTWSNATAYAKDDCVFYGGSSYVALGASTNAQPDVSPASWAVMAAQGATGAQGEAGPIGPQGIQGPAGSPDTQAQILDKIAAQADGTVLAVQQGSAEAASTVKLKVMNSGGVEKATIKADGTVSTSRLLVPFNGTGTGKDVSMVNISPADNSAMLAVYPSNGVNATATMSVMPLGSGYNSALKSNIYVYNTDRLADPTNWEALMLRAAGADYRFISYQAGTGAIRPINFQMGYGVNVLSLANNLNVGIGTSTPTQKLEVAGGVKINSSGTQPTCNDATRGTFWVVKGASNDVVQVCVLSGGVTIWRSLW